MKQFRTFALIALAVCAILAGPSSAQQPLRKVLQKCFGKDCQQQSTGFMVVNQFDTDGALITSVGPVVDPVPAMAPALPSVVPSVTFEASSAPAERSIAAGSTARDFRSALLKAARQERGGSITVGEYFAIFVGSLNATKLEQAKLAVADSAIQDGVLPANQSIGAIDWEKLIELIIKYLPMILDLFKGK